VKVHYSSQFQLYEEKFSSQRKALNVLITTSTKEITIHIFYISIIN